LILRDFVEKTRRIQGRKSIDEALIFCRNPCKKVLRDRLTITELPTHVG
jgi:hypothetical protein